MNEITQVLQRIPGTKLNDINRPPVVISFAEDCDPEHPLAGLSKAERTRSREHALASVLAAAIRENRENVGQ